MKSRRTILGSSVKEPSPEQVGEEGLVAER